MSQTDTPHAMHAKSSSASDTSWTDVLRLRQAKTVMAADAKPEAVLEEIRDLITDHLLAARRLAAEASVRFPDHDGIRNADRLLNHGRAQVTNGGPEASRDEEIEWLRHPPDSVRGQWVGLVGAELVGSAKTLAELIEHLQSMNLEEQALVHRIDG